MAYAGTITFTSPGINTSSICIPDAGVTRGTPPGMAGLRRRLSLMTASRYGISLTFANDQSLSPFGNTD